MDGWVERMVGNVGLLANLILNQLLFKRFFCSVWRESPIGFLLFELNWRSTTSTVVVAAVHPPPLSIVIYPLYGQIVMIIMDVVGCCRRPEYREKSSVLENTMTATTRRRGEPQSFLTMLLRHHCFCYGRTAGRSSGRSLRGWLAGWLGNCLKGENNCYLHFLLFLLFHGLVSFLYRWPFSVVFLHISLSLSFLLCVQSTSFGLFPVPWKQVDLLVSRLPARSGVCFTC